MFYPIFTSVSSLITIIVLVLVILSSCSLDGIASSYSPTPIFSNFNFAAAGD
jgi:Calcineurin-like phosphoesterase